MGFTAPATAGAEFTVHFNKINRSYAVSFYSCHDNNNVTKPVSVPPRLEVESLVRALEVVSQTQNNLSRNLTRARVRI